MKQLYHLILSCSTFRDAHKFLTFVRLLKVLLLINSLRSSNCTRDPEKELKHESNASHFHREGLLIIL